MEGWPFSTCLTPLELKFWNFNDLPLYELLTELDATFCRRPQIGPGFCNSCGYSKFSKIRIYCGVARGKYPTMDSGQVLKGSKTCLAAHQTSWFYKTRPLVIILRILSHIGHSWSLIRRKPCFGTALNVSIYLGATQVPEHHQNWLEFSSWV